jgi:hypothetical protein
LSSWLSLQDRSLQDRWSAHEDDASFLVDPHDIDDCYRLVFEIDVSELLVTVDHDEAGGQFLDGPWRREARWLFEAMRIRPV